MIVVCKAADAEGVPIYIPRFLLSAQSENDAAVNSQRSLEWDDISSEDSRIVNNPCFRSNRLTPPVDASMGSVVSKSVDNIPNGEAGLSNRRFEKSWAVDMDVSTPPLHRVVTVNVKEEPEEVIPMVSNGSAFLLIHYICTSFRRR